MAFSVVHPQNSQTIWVPIAHSDVIYTGALVKWDTATPAWGVVPMNAASGVADKDNLDIPFGVCVGNNNISGNVTFSTTYNAEYITATSEANAHANTTQYQNVEGNTPRGDKVAMVEVIPITAETVLRGPIYNAAYGTAPTAVSPSAASTDGLDFNSATAITVATVANFSTVYCRTGDNQGVYRIINTASQTTHQNTTAFPYDIATTDTFVFVNGLRPWGRSKMQLDAEGMYIENSAALTADYYEVDVLRLDLSTSGEEYVEFRFGAVHFISTDRQDLTA